jgi:3-hydroxyphenylacetate 6-hydroxylase
MAMSSHFHHVEYLTLEHLVQFLVLTSLVVPILYIVANEFIRAAARIPNLGGPVGFPLIGNLWQIRTNAAEQYRSWSKKYGSVYQVQLGNIPIVVVNTATAAKTIFGQNSQALSSRPEFYTFHKVSRIDYCVEEQNDDSCIRCFLTQLAQQSGRPHTVIH